MPAKRKAPRHRYDLPANETSQLRTRKMRKLDDETQDHEKGGVSLPQAVMCTALQEVNPKRPAINARVRSERSQTPTRTSMWPKRRQADKDDLDERSKREERWVLETAMRLPDTDSSGALNKLINSRWTSGWLMYFKRRIRPITVSIRLLKDLAVMSFHLSIAEANEALILQVSDRAFGPADVKDALTAYTGRMWSELKRQALRLSEE